MTIDLINVFCRQSIIGIDPINVFLTIGAHLWFYICIRYLLLFWMPTQVFFKLKGTVQRKLRGVESYINQKDFVSHWTADILF